MLFWLLVVCTPKQKSESFVLFPPPVAIVDPGPYEVFGIQLDQLYVQIHSKMQNNEEAYLVHIDYYKVLE